MSSREDMEDYRELIDDIENSPSKVDFREEYVGGENIPDFVLKRRKLKK